MYIVEDSYMKVSSEKRVKENDNTNKRSNVKRGKLHALVIVVMQHHVPLRMLCALKPKKIVSKHL